MGVVGEEAGGTARAVGRVDAQNLPLLHCVFSAAPSSLSNCHVHFGVCPLDSQAHKTLCFSEFEAPSLALTKVGPHLQEVRSGSSTHNQPPSFYLNFHLLVLGV